MKKLTKVIMSGAAVAALGCTMAASLTGCGNDKSTINITGSSSVSPLMSVLADEYMDAHSNVNILVQTSDSTSGVTDTQSGKNNLGMASRALKDEETGVTSVKICDDGVALIVNPNCTVTSVTSAEVYELYANGTAIQGTLTNAITREDGSGTRDAFDGLIKNVAGNKLSALTSFADCVEESNGTGAVKSDIAANSNGNKVGYISMGALNNTVKALVYEGVEATAANVKSGDYKLARPFNVLYNTEKGLSGATKEFLDWILSAEGQQIVESEGYVTIL